ncbi:MAG: peptide ABC transporter substrate-binding protein [Puniceicoccales bacterium]|nr:peptide ABC transporter substrate-binding protein [Puniceicoccales bacterium]
MGNGAEPSSLDPHAVNGVPEATILLSLFEGLLVPDPKTAEPCPGAASSWYISPDGLRYVFNLRENLRWSNGDPLVAKDFVYTFRRAISPKMGNPWVSFYYNVRNAEAYATGKIGDFSDVGIRAIDDLTLEIILERPVVYFLELLAHVAWLPVHRDTIEKFGALDERDTRWIRPGNMVCNGPFMLKSWENGNYILVVKNPHYWDKDNVALEKIYFHAVSDSATEERMYAAGDLDISSGLHVSKRPHYAKKGELHIDPYMGCAWVAVNCQRPPFNDPRIRKALALAINREEVNKIRGFGKDINAYGAVPPDVHHYRSIKQGFQEDVQEARRLLAEAGYPGGKGFPKTEVLYNFSDQHHLVFEVLQSMWERNLGIHVDLVSQEWKVYLSMMGRGDFTLGRHCWVGDYNDPMTMLEIFEGGSANNYTAWASTQYDYYLHQARNTANEEKRIGFLQEAERIFVKEMPAIPLFWMNSIHLVSPRVKGWYPNVMDVHLWKGISKSKD